MKRWAFTLLELLVVIAIIGVLAALVMSVLASVSNSTQATQCAANLRQLALANIAYASDNSGQYVPAQDARNRIRWHGTRSSSQGEFDPTKGPLAPYLGGDGRIKLCPTFTKALKGAQSFENGTGGYGYNAAYIGGIPASFYTSERVANVWHPAQTVMFTDTAFARAGGIQEYAWCEPFQWVDSSGQLAGALSASVHFRHKERANVAWCDGHVSSEPYSKLDGGNVYGGNGSQWQIGWFGPGAENGFWNPRRE